MITEKLKIAYRLNNKERAALKEKVMAYTNHDVIKKYSDEMGISEEEAEIAFTELKKFLYVCGATTGGLTPSSELDAIWHQFILFTKEYGRFCNRYFGKTIHHSPDVEFDSETRKINNEAYTRAWEIANAEFDNLNSEYWMNPNFVNVSKCCKSDSKVSNCNTKRLTAAKCTNK